MKRYLLAVLVGLCLLAATGCTEKTDLIGEGGKTGKAQKPPKIRPGDLDTDYSKTRLAVKFSERRFLTRAATYAYNLETLVGHALYIEKTNGLCPSGLTDSYDAASLSAKSYLKQGAKIVGGTPGAVLYARKLDHGAATELKIIVVGATGDANTISELIVTDVATANLPTNGFEPNWDTDAASRMTANDCAVALINGATLTSAVSKDYRKVKAGAEASGGVYHAEGSFYEEDSAVRNDLLISLDVLRSRIPVTPSGSRTQVGLAARTPGPEPVERSSPIPRSLRASNGVLRVRG